MKDPVEEKYKELMEDLKVFKSKVNILEFLETERFNEDKDELSKRERPWKSIHS
jgi:hypothetical protein